MTNGSLMKVESIAECFKGSILQYFWPALRDNWSWKPFFGTFESGCFTQVLLCHAIRNHLNSIWWIAEQGHSWTLNSPAGKSKIYTKMHSFEVWIPLNLFVGFDSLYPINNPFSYVGTGLPEFNQTKLGLMCLAQGHNAVTLLRL